jgi:hypothetical protein
MTAQSSDDTQQRLKRIFEGAFSGSPTPLPSVAFL